MSEKLRDILHGARRIEIFILVIVFSVIGLYLMHSSRDIDMSSDTVIESRLESILSGINGVKRPEVMVTQEENGKFVGVVVVAEGITDISTRINIQNAIKTLLNIEISRIEIIDRG